jgi:hypothetical protein
MNHESSREPASSFHARLEPFVGTWATTGRLRQADEAGLMQASDIYEWLHGGHFLLHRWDARFPESRTQGIEMIGYDASQSDYFMHSFDSEGNAGVMRASTADGRNWTFLSDTLRFTGGFDQDGGVFSGLWEQRSGGDSPWIPWMDITLRKIG